MTKPTTMMAAILAAALGTVGAADAHESGHGRHAERLGHAPTASESPTEILTVLDVETSDDTASREQRV